MRAWLEPGTYDTSSTHPMTTEILLLGTHLVCILIWWYYFFKFLVGANNQPSLSDHLPIAWEWPRRGGVLLGILGVGVPSGSPNPDPILDQKMSFSTPVFRPGLKAEIMLSLLKLVRKQNISSNAFRIRIFLFLSYSFGIETINTFIRSRSSLEKHTRRVAA